MKILPPTLREKKRYLAIDIISENKINRHQFLKTLQYNITSLFGDTGLSETKVKLLYFDGNFGIIKCVPAKIWLVRAGLATITHISGGRTTVQVKGVSGTVLAAKERYKKQNNSE